MKKLYLQSCIDVGVTPNRDTYARLDKTTKNDETISMADIWETIKLWEDDNND